MFEHLDDPAPPAFGDDFRSRVVGRARSLRRRRRVAVGGLTAVATLLVGVVGIYADAARQLGDVERVEVAGTADGSDAGDGPQTFLVIGTDGRVGDEFPVHTDTIVALRTDPDGALSTMSIPRDLAVEHPRTGAPTRINSILPDLGLSGLVQVVEAQVGIPVDHVVQVDFEGFIDLVDLVGGIDVQVDAPLRDRMTGLDLAEPGCVHLDGLRALQLARARQLETFRDGRWRTDPRGDLGRIERLQPMMVAALQALGSARPGPLDANRLAGWAVDHLVISDGLDRSDLVDLARLAMDLDPTEVASGSLPVVEHTLDGGFAALAPADGADQTVQAFHDGELLTRRIDHGVAVRPC